MDTDAPVTGPSVTSQGAGRPQIGTWALERLAVQTFHEQNLQAGGTLHSADRHRIRAELAEHFEVRHTVTDWLKDCGLALSLTATAAVVIVAVLGLS